MVKQNSVAGIHSVSFAIIYDDPVAVQLRNGIRRARVKRRRLLLRYLLNEAVEFGSARLIKPGLLLKAQDSDRFEQSQHTKGVRIRRILRLFKRDLHMRLRRQIVDLIRLHLLYDVDQRCRISHIPVMQDELGILVMRIFVDMIDARSVEQRSAPLDAMHFVSLS